MKSTRLARILLASAALLFTAGLATWVSTGRHVGWTQTSTVTMQRDEITGIDYPVRTPGFVAGVEIPVATATAAVVFASLAWFVQRPRVVRA